jgi:hypothetical protein
MVFELLGRIFGVSLAGDFYETLIYCDFAENLIPYLKNTVAYDEIIWHETNDDGLCFLEIKAQQFLDENILQEILDMGEVRYIKSKYDNIYTYYYCTQVVTLSSIWLVQQ